MSFLQTRALREDFWRFVFFPMSVFKAAVCPQQCRQGEVDTSKLHQHHGKSSLTTHSDGVRRREHRH